MSTYIETVIVGGRQAGLATSYYLSQQDQGFAPATFGKEMVTMRISKLCIIIGLILAFGLFFEIAAHASETTQQTRIEFVYPTQQEQQIAHADLQTFIGNRPISVGYVRSN